LTLRECHRIHSMGHFDFGGVAALRQRESANN
jgi:hypothetical protein